MNKTSNKVLLTFVHVPSSSCPYVISLKGYNHSTYTILRPAFFSKAILYKFFHIALMLADHFEQIHGIPLHRGITIT